MAETKLFDRDGRQIFLGDIVDPTTGQSGAMKAAEVGDIQKLQYLKDRHADFNLQDHGVSVGDHIVYTPTGQELTVLEDNKVEYGGEQMSIGEFTAKNMPENSISKSGVCKGPKYFSYKGVSLYKLKESFLGGQKKK